MFDLIHRPAMLMHRPAMLMHRLAMPIHRPVMPMHRPVMLMHRPVMLIHRLAMLIHRLAMLIHRPVMLMQDDYARKVEEYAFLNIPEYWIVDFRGLGGLQFIGNPNQPTFTVCQLVNGVYQQQQYRLGDTIFSDVLPNLQLKLDDIMHI